jgi:hypothetical protein
MTLGVVIHEYIHYFDLQKYPKSDEVLCGFSMPREFPSNWEEFKYFSDSALGYYTFTIDKENMTTSELADYKTTAENTEYKAYTVSFLIALLFIISYLIYSYTIFKKNDELEDHKNDKEYVHMLEDYIYRHRQDLNTSNNPLNNP